MIEFNVNEITDKDYVEKKNIFGTRFYYFEDDVRIRLGYKIVYLDIVYSLQRKTKKGWHTVAWTYPSTHKGDKFLNIVKYLFRLENYGKI